MAGEGEVPPWGQGGAGRGPLGQSFWRRPRPAVHRCPLLTGRLPATCMAMLWPPPTVSTL